MVVSKNSQMEPTGAPTSSSASGRTSVIDSLRGFTLAGVRVNKEELRRKVTIPGYLRLAMREAIRERSGGEAAAAAAVRLQEEADPAEWPTVVFVNSKSGGRHGPELKARLQELMGEEQVFDLSEVKPHEFVQHGLSCLESFASLGDKCAQETREKLKIVVAGGDGTVGWVLGCLGELSKQGRLPVPPTGIIPLGTGNDLSRSFGWGGSFPFNWKSAMKRTLEKIATGPSARLDSWQVLISMPSRIELDTPYSLKATEQTPLDLVCMDARVAHGFHHLRNERPYLARGPISNKVKDLTFDQFFEFSMIYSGYSCTQGWFCTPCSSDPGLRSLKNILRIYIKKVHASKWEQIPVPLSVRSIVALNLPNYGSGRNPWGKLKPNYLEKRGFVEAHADDGVLEIFGLKHGWHASMVMAELISAKHIAQVSAVRFELRGGEWKNSYMQMDGEPWKQPMDKDFSTFIEIKRVPHQSVMIVRD
ncbi:diacylglycerol kinase family protein [Striga asiatica]|uniref:Diacylglycerol kinase n=1 Tax=Striga asiatica TaxID=4170 RepID=A0A5A7R3U4_STRAF|nr:diacylglycerol kinase family protein [Striga asiatica]